MKLRSFILVCCMVIVPGLAMFSHHLPAATWRSLWLAAAATVASVDRGVADQAAPGPAPEVPEATGSRRPVADQSGIAHAVTEHSVGEQAPRSGGDPDAPRRTALGRLAELGATMIDCQPPAAGGGPVIGSCRVPVEPSGQLQRLFQVSAPDATTALEALADDVSAWRRRMSAP
jgi:hypothetical protein